jgi:hypothetical protein
LQIGDLVKVDMAGGVEVLLCYHNALWQLAPAAQTSSKAAHGATKRGMIPLKSSV